VALYQLRVDWGNDGTYGHALADITGDVLEVSCVAGRERPFEFLSGSRVGELTARLRNESGKYSLFQTSSPLAGLLRPGKLVQLRRYVDSSTGWVPLWTGYLDRITPDALLPPTAQLRALGPLSVMAVRTVWTAALANVSSDTAVTAVLDAAGWPTSRRQVNPGSSTLVRHYTRGEDALTALKAIEQAELGLMREAPDGSLVFEGRGYRKTGSRLTVQCTLSSAPADLAAGALAYLDLRQDDPVESVVNEATWSIQQYTTGAQQVVATLTEVPFTVAPNQSVSYTLQYPPAGQSTEGYVSSWVTPTVGTSGTDIIVSSTTGISVTLTNALATRATVTITNSSGAGVTVSQVQLRGTPVTPGTTTGVVQSDSGSQASFGRRAVTAQSSWINTNQARDFAQATVNRYAAPVPTVTVTFAAEMSAEHARQAALRTVSDRVKVREPIVLGLDMEAFIERVEHRITPDTHTVSWVLAPAVAESAWVLGTSQLGVDTKLGF
jgi:hypothetical protein